MAVLSLITSGPDFVMGNVLEFLLIGGEIAFYFVCRGREKKKLALD